MTPIELEPKLSRTALRRYVLSWHPNSATPRIAYSQHFIPLMSFCLRPSLAAKQSLGCNCCSNCKYEFDEFYLNKHLKLCRTPQRTFKSTLWVCCGTDTYTHPHTHTDTEFPDRFVPTVYTYKVFDWNVQET